MAALSRACLLAATVLLAMSAAPAAAHRIDTAVAPSASRFMWQNLQERFRTKAGKACRANVSMGATIDAICYVSPARRLRCAGRIGEKDYGSTFRLTGQTNVRQLLLRGDGLWVCTLSRQGRLACTGFSLAGELANGQSSTTSFLPWGDPTWRFTHLATGDGLQICARRTDGSIYCAGRFRKPDGTEVTTGTPEPVGTGKTFWVDVDEAQVRIDDPAVFRAQDGFTSNVVTASGLETDTATYGTPGKVVAGNGVSSACWLESDGAVACQREPDNLDPTPPLVPAFTQGKAIFLSGGFGIDPLCAVFNDGALWCRGTTPMGSFAAETQLAPPGSLPRTCRP